jgi:parallel beta-helix repeat protein
MKKILAVMLFFVLSLVFPNAGLAYVIWDNAVGGDCVLFGIWDTTTKTCTLSTDVTLNADIYDIRDRIFLGSNVTVDGNGHTVAALHQGTGCGFDLGSNINITIRNVRIMGFHKGIILNGAKGANLGDNTIIGPVPYVSDPWNAGIHLGRGASGNTIQKNNISNHSIGILLIGESDNNTISDNYIFNNYTGIIDVSYDNLITGNSVINNSQGIYLGGDRATVRDNTIANNRMYGLHLYNYFFCDNVIYHNNFISNHTDAQHAYAPWAGYCMNAFNLDAPTGGNYWSKYDTPAEGCNDINNDGFCDAPYYWLQNNPYTDHVDYFPFTKADGWISPEKLISELINTIGNLQISGEITNAGVANSLTAMLQSALDALNQGDVQTTDNILNAFVNHIEAQTGKKISDDAAAYLISVINQVLSKI